MNRSTAVLANCLLVGLLVVGTAVLPAGAALTLAQPEQLLSGPGRTERPAFSPDGSQLAYLAKQGDLENLYLKRMDGGEPVALTHNQRADVQFGGPSWAPGGDFLVYSSNQGESGSYDLYVVSADGQHEEALTVEPSLDWMPAWSPDGRTIAFVSDRENGDALWVVGVDGTGLKKVADLCYEPAWGPDGQRLVAYHIRGGNDGIYLFDGVDDANPKLLIDQGRMPTFSSDGRYVVAVRSDETGERLWAADLQNDTAGPLSAALGGVAWPSWSARGPQLAFELKRDNAKQICVAEVGESRPIAVLSEPAAGTSVRGAVRVVARVGAEGGGVAGWRLEAGQGASPQAWTLVAEGTGEVDGDLATWKTTGLEGLQTLRLTVISDSGETTITAIPVNVFGQYGERWEGHDVPAQMVAQRTYPIELRVTNTGTMTWRTDGQFPVEGCYQWLSSAGKVVVAEGLSSSFAAPVPAGQTAVLKAQVAAPREAGSYTLRYDLRQGGQVWFGEQGAQALDLPISVNEEYALIYDVPSAPGVLVPGQIYQVEVRLTNLGLAAWPGLDGAPQAGPQTVSILDRWLDLDGGLVDAEPVLTPLPLTIEPSRTQSVQARVQAPAVAGRYHLAFDLVDAEGLFSKRVSWQPKGAEVRVSSPYSATFLQDNTPGRMFPGELLSINLQCRNSGSTRWRAQGPSAVHLSYQWLQRDGSVSGTTALQTELPYDVLPGMTAAVTAKVQSPGEPGEYTLAWDLAQRGGRPFSELGSQSLKVPVMVGARTHSVRWEQIHHPVEMVVGSVYTVELRVTNEGAMTWSPEGPEGVRVAYHWRRPDGETLTRAPIFTTLEKPVNTAESRRVSARVQAPDRPGQYMLSWDLYQGGYDFFSTRGASTLDVPVTVQVIYGARYVSHDTPTRLVGGTKYLVNLRVKNTGTIPWEARGTVPVTLSYRWYSATGEEVLTTKQLRTELPRTIQPGENLEISAYLEAPSQPGRYDLEWDLLFASAFWFSEKGVEPLRVPVIVE